MSIRRITISVQEEVASRIKKASGSQPVSAWVTEVIEDHLDDAELEKEWQRFYRDVSPTRPDRQRAEVLFRRLTRRPARRRRAA